MNKSISITVENGDFKNIYTIRDDGGLSIIEQVGDLIDGEAISHAFSPNETKMIKKVLELGSKQ